MLFILLLTVSVLIKSAPIHRMFVGSPVPEVVNTCVDPVVLPNTGITYTLCKFETVLHFSNPATTWKFLGADPSEGILCVGDVGSYVNAVGEVVATPLSVHFSEIDCKDLTLHVDRYMPNLWLKNITLKYYYAEGNGTFSTAGLLNFDVQYV